MLITVTELRNNLEKYLFLSVAEDVLITKNGKVIAKLTNPHQDKVKIAKSLFGILPKDADLKEARIERLREKWLKVIVSTDVIIDDFTYRDL